jgi:hypothetical protein
MVNEAAVMMRAAMRLNDIPRDRVVAMRAAMPGVQAAARSAPTDEKIGEPTLQA